jgi:Bax protein
MLNSTHDASLKHPARRIAVSLAAVGLLATIAVADQTQHFKPPVKTVEAPRTAAATAGILEDSDYNLAKVRESKVVPRIYLQDIPLDMSSVQPVQTKKDLFIRILLPLVLEANEEIAAQRTRLIALQGKEAPSAEEKAWLSALAEAYSGAADDVTDLLDRVDVIPVSLGLAQGIDESGWGTSRFAREGESLFGQHAPKDDKRLDAARAGGVGVAAFTGMLKSVQGYFHNLNSTRAYAQLREMRSKLRREGRQPAGVDLLPGLASYSERGAAYIHDLQSIMRVNGLDAYEDANLDPQSGSIVIRPGS